MNISFLILCTLCAVILSKLMSIMYNQYVLWHKVRHVPVTDEFTLTTIAPRIVRKSDHGKKCCVFSTFLPRTYTVAKFILLYLLIPLISLNV